MGQEALTLESSIRFLRIVYLVILAAMIDEVLVAEKLINHVVRDIRTFWLAMLAVGVAEIGIAISFRNRMLGPAMDVLQSSPNNVVALGKWRAANILSFVLSNAVVLFGFAVRFTGGTTMQSLPFYVAGFSMMLLWWPRRP